MIDNKVRKVRISQLWFQQCAYRRMRQRVPSVVMLNRHQRLRSSLLLLLPHLLLCQQTRRTTSWREGSGDTRWVSQTDVGLDAAAEVLMLPNRVYTSRRRRRACTAVRAARRPRHDRTTGVQPGLTWASQAAQAAGYLAAAAARVWPASEHDRQSSVARTITKISSRPLPPYALAQHIPSLVTLINYCRLSLCIGYNRDSTWVWRRTTMNSKSNRSCHQRLSKSDYSSRALMVETVN